MIIIGFFGNFYRGTHDASCVLIKDGEVVSYIEEERLLRIKHAQGYVPQRALNYILKKFGINLNEVIVAFPQTTWKDFPRRIEQFFYYQFNQQPKKILYFPHHLSHAASSFYSSGFKSSAIITADYSGDNASTGFYHGIGSKINKIKEISSANSLGTFYSAITQYLGFERNLDEYKVMGLASFGEPKINMDDWVKVGDLEYSINDKYINPDLFLAYPHFLSNQQPIFNKNIDKLFGPHRLRGEGITKKHKDIAASTQKKLEVTILRLVDKLMKKTDEENLCAAGGIFLNCTLNGVISRSGLVKNLYVPPVAGDNGVSLGAAYLAAISLKERIRPLSSPYLGSSYSESETKAIIKRSKLSYKKVKKIENEIAKRLARGEIVGNFSGKMEIGARALGNRSILADPRDPRMKDKINKFVKFREEFRPFAPAVLKEKAQDYFEKISSSPYMTMSFMVKEKMQRVIPATTHVDGSARVQTVDKNINERFWKIIKSFENITKVPVVLNTSLNRNFEPIVESPDQAIAVFAATGMDALAVGNFLFTKNP